MSDCGVCVSNYGDGDDCTMYRCVIVKKSKNEWRCSECDVRIPKGTSYELASWLNDGSYGNAKTCLLCAEVADAFQCNGRYHGGCFWDDMSESFHALNTSCFSRLKTVAAKMELRRRWCEWKFGYYNRKDAELRKKSMLDRAKGVSV